MAKFREISTGRVWDITNNEHLKHFRANPRFEEIKDKKNKSNKSKEEKENKKDSKLEDSSLEESKTNE